ncbi:hypothetical protein NS2_71990 [Nocardia seriolae NBRC 15557]|nr:hypothetical protein NS2_71990 [Nocardia seriolae NBRC 15557]
MPTYKRGPMLTEADLFGSLGSGFRLLLECPDFQLRFGGHDIGGRTPRPFLRERRRTPEQTGAIPSLSPAPIQYRTTYEVR